jgi:hypothetical protein
LVLKMEVLAGQQDPYSQQVKARSTIATPFDELYIGWPPV